jgi:mono/diheme cytochrome c family protein
MRTTLTPFKLGLMALALIAVVAGGMVLAPDDAMAQEDDSMSEHPGFLAAKGRITYRRYCASCHGADADGKGNVAQFLTVAPPDLRTFLKRYDGEFPQELIYESIDGRKVVRTHGSRDMPIWGEVFQSPLVETSTVEESGEERADRKIRELVYYLETLQQPVESDG